MQMPLTIDGEEYLNSTEAKDFLGISSWEAFTTIVRREHLTRKKRGFGKAIYYAKSELEDLLKLRDVDEKEEGGLDV